MLLESFLNIHFRFVPTRHVHAAERGLNYIRHQSLGPLLLRDGGILNASERRCIAHIHLLGILFVSLNEVDDHVDHDFSFSVALHHPDVLLDSRERCDVIVCDLRNFGE